jgi:hypothetical protein
MLHFDTGNILHHELTPEGYLRCYGQIARTGELRYIKSDGTERIEVVTPEVLFNKTSIDSFKMKTVTNNHPPVKLDSNNTKNYIAGMTSNVAVIDGSFLGIAMTIVDQDTIDDIVKGNKRQISCGYETELEKREDGKYYQIYRSGNHIAIVDRGRAGSNVALKLDSWNMDLESDTEEDTIKYKSALDKISVDNISRNDNSDRKTIMQKFNLDGFEFETENLELAKHARSVDSQLDRLKTTSKDLQTRFDSIAAENQALITKVSTLDGTSEALKAENVQLNADKADLTAKLEAASAQTISEAEITKAVTERLDMWDKVLPEFRSDKADFKPDFSKSAIQIKTDYVKLKYPNMNLDCKDASFIDGMFEVAISQKVENKDTAGIVDDVLPGINSSRSDSATESKLDKVVGAYVSQMESAWKTT